MKNTGNIVNLFNSVNEYWSPKVIADVNDDYIKIAKLKGDISYGITMNRKMKCFML